MSENAQGILDTILDRLGELASSETVIGDPVTVGDIIILPVIKISIGFGAGVGQGNTEHKNDQSGGGGGGGASVKPVGFLVWDGSEVKFVNVAGKGSLDSLIDLVPDLLKKFGLSRNKSAKTADNSDTEEE